MHEFRFKKNRLYCEDLPVQELATKYGTPLFVYSSRTIVDHFLKIKKAFSSIKPLICYSAKVNSNLSIMKLLVDQGAGLDIVSGGELYRAKKVKCPAKKIVYASVGKTDREIKEALDYGILMFTVESLAELKRINALARKLKLRADVALRLNPDVAPKTHSYIITGKKETKFGMDIDTVKEILLVRDNYPYLNIIGIHIHIGSQITESAPYLKAIRKVKELVDEVSRAGVQLKYFDIGGGLGIVYNKEKAQTAQSFAKQVLPLLKSIGLKVILEPGRFIVGNSGILVTKVIYLKDTFKKRFIIVDAAMNDMIRPSLYGAYHNIITVKKAQSKKAKPKKLVDVVGPICESGDFLGKARNLTVNEGDYLAIMAAGAYCFSMSSNYNSRPRAAEIIVKKDKAQRIRRREKYADLVKSERIVF